MKQDNLRRGQCFKTGKAPSARRGENGPGDKAGETPALSPSPDDEETRVREDPAHRPGYPV